MLKLYMVISCVLILPVSVYGQTANINLETLVNICQAYENTVTDVNIEYEYEIMGPAKNLDSSEDAFNSVGPQKHYLVAKKPFEQFYKFRQILRSENKKGGSLQADVTKTYDGKVFKECQKVDDKTYFGWITDKPASIWEEIYIFSPLGFTIFKRNETEPLLDILKGNYDYYTLWLDPNISRINDFNAVEVACIANRWKIPNSKALSIYFSVDHNYAIVKIVLYKGPNHLGGPQEVSAAYDVEQLKDLGNGIWFPYKTSIVVDGNSVINKLKVNKVVINEGLNDKSKNFDLEFPPGTKVQDHITGKQYIIKPTQEQVDRSAPK